MSEKYIISHDMGTSSNKAILMTVFGNIIGSVKRNYPLYHPKPDYAEQDPLDWWHAVCDSTKSVLSETKIPARDVVGITFSTQMQCLLPISEDGQPLTRALTWLDGRSAQIIRKTLWTPPRIKGYNIFKLLHFLRITGGTPGHTGKDQIGKILWLKENKPEIFAKTFKFIDAKDFIIYQLTGNIVTSVDLAVVWWLLDTRKNRNQWSSKLCKIAGISSDQLATVKESAAAVGKVTKLTADKIGLLPGTPVINGAGDLSSAALGSGAINEGALHINVGTSGWVAGHFSKRKIDIAHYTGCIGSAYPQKYYLGMAHQETAGLCLEWLRNNVLYYKDQLLTEGNVNEVYQLLDQLAAQSPPGAEGLIFTPWMYGERCPLDDENIRAGLFNLSLNHSREHIVRAVLEGVAFNTRWAMETLENLYTSVDTLNIIGGGAQSEIWCQIFADITGRTINQVAESQQAGARGVGLLASMTLGYIDSFADIEKYIKINKTFYPTPRYQDLYNRLYWEFKNIYKQNKKWYARMNRAKN